MKMKRTLTTLTMIVAAAALMSGCSNMLNDLSAAPEAPQELTVSQSGSDVELSWNDFAETEDEYLIRRRINGGEWETVAAVSEDTGSFTDTEADKVSGTYTYRVVAQNQHGEAPSQTAELVYDAILGGSTEEVDLPQDSDADGSADTTVSATLVDTDADGTYDGIDLDGQTGTAELDLEPVPDEPGLYHVDANGDGTSEFTVDINAGSSGGETHISHRESGESVNLITDSDGSVSGLDTDGDGAVNAQATDVLGPALSTEGAEISWPAGSDGQEHVNVGVLDAYTGDSDTGSLDFDGDGRADVFVEDTADPDDDGVLSYGIDSDGDGTIEFWSEGCTGIHSNAEADMSGAEVSVVVDSEGTATGFDTDGDGTADSEATDPLDGASGGETVRIPSIEESSGERSETTADIVGSDPFAFGDDSPLSGLDFDDDGTTDLNLEASGSEGVYGADINGDGNADLFMQTSPGVTFTENEDGTGTQLDVVEQSGTGIGFDADGDAKVDFGFSGEDGEISFNDPGTTLPTVSFETTYENESSDDGTLQYDETMDVEASLSEGSTSEWTWRLDGVVVSEETASTFTVDPDDPGTDLNDDDLSTVDPGEYHTLTATANEVTGIDGPSTDVSETYEFTVQQEQ